MNLQFLPLQAFCKIGSGSTPPRSKSSEYFGGGIPWVKSGELRETIIMDTEEHITQKAIAETSVKVVPAGAILLAMYGATVGRMGKLGVEATTNQAVCFLIPDEKIADTDYLYYCLRSKVPQLLDQRVGGAQPNISQLIIKQTVVPLPDLERQRFIARVFQQLEDLRQKRCQSLQVLQELPKSAFVDYFGNVITNDKNWNLARFSDVCDSRLGKMLDAKKQTGANNHPYLRNANVQWNRLVLDDLLQMDFDDTDQRSFRLQYGDVLICEGGDVGRSAVWRNEMAECYYQKALHRARLSPDKLTPEYLVFLMWFLATNNGFRKYVSSATIAHLTGEKLKQLMLPIPPIELQKQFSSLVLEIDRQQALFQTSLHYFDHLYNSLAIQLFNHTNQPNEAIGMTANV